ncbi:hypothetical protein [Actinomadura napierensis]|uniref:Uncharacterized protein n=1 Tax=Actinomadura napierensis TaxID=267854 RepID=A0ABP5M1Z0_9ACTN
MTNDPAPTSRQRDSLAGSDAAQQRRPRLINTARSSFSNWRPPHVIRNHVRALVERRFAHEHKKPSTDSEGRDDLLINLFGAPHGAGLIGPGAAGLQRAALIEAFACEDGISQIVIDDANLVRLFGHLIDDDLGEALGDRLYLTDLLENAIEYIESETKRVPASETSAPDQETAPIAWFAAPGHDADVVLQLLRTWRMPNVVALISGPWAYGPTHYIEVDGPRKLPHRPMTLPTPAQATEALRGVTDRT